MPDNPTTETAQSARSHRSHQITRTAQENIRKRATGKKNSAHQFSDFPCEFKAAYRKNEGARSGYVLNAPSGSLSSFSGAAMICGASSPTFVFLFPSAWIIRARKRGSIFENRTRGTSDADLSYILSAPSSISVVCTCLLN